MKQITPLLIAAALALAGCGGDEEEAPAQGAQRTPVATSTPTDTATSTPARTPKPARGKRGTKITIGQSEFGDMLFDSRKQAIYIFENDPKDKSVCYDECAVAWPPVYTDGDPVAGKGVESKLLGTVKRRDGKHQVTYAGKPLYFYVNEAPGEVRCHNVNLNGGLWWVVGPDGKRRP